MTTKSVLVLSLFLSVLFSFTHGQDLDRLHSRVEQLAALREIREEFSQEFVDIAQKAIDSLTKLWTEPGSAKSVINTKNGSIPWNCLWAAWNLTHYKDSLGLPVAVDVLDSFGKLGPGILSGDLYLTGSYDECLNIPDDLTQYCMVSTTIPLPIQLPLPFTFGMCLPQECTVNDIHTLVDMIPGMNVEINPLMPDYPVSCQPYMNPPYHWTAIAMIIVCCLITCLVVFSTLADLSIRLWRDGALQKYLLHAPNSKTMSKVSDKTPLLGPLATRKPQRFDRVEWVQAFSLYKTIPTILSTKQTSAAIRCLNGIRVISMFWVILCHTHIWVSYYSGADNISDFLNTLKRFSFQAVSNGFFSVDSFFFLSGVLVAYLTLRQMKRKNGRFPVLMFYVHRYLRLTPVYAFVLFFTWFLSMHLANGPHYKVQWVGGYSWQYCDKYWWTNLVYINNLYPWKLGEECIGWSWYLANDMQFYIISPLIIIPMYFLLPVGLIVACALLLVSFVVTAVLTGVFDFQSSSFAALAYQYAAPNITANSQDDLYIKPWHRIQPYLVGLLLGYLLFRQVKVPFNRYFKLGSYLVMWCLAIIFCMSTLYGLYSIWHGHVPSLGENIIYLTFSRFTWAVGLALLVFICHNGYGGWVNSFLSMSVWTPLSRLTYNAYLIHPVVLTVVFGSMRNPVHYGDIEMAVYAVANSVLSFGVAFILAVFVEFPFGNLEMAFFKLFGVGARESTRADTEAKRPTSPLHSEGYTGASYSTNSDTKPNKTNHA